MANTAPLIKAQDEADAAAWAAIRHDYDAHGFFHQCNLHPEHPGHLYLTHCVICPEDGGNGRESTAAREARRAALIKDYPDLPF